MSSQYFLLAIAAGTVLPLQALVNAQLGRVLGGPLWAVAVSFLVGTLGLTAFQLVFLRSALPSLSHAAGPLWIWLGGLLGAVYVAGVVITVPRLGPAPMIALVVFGQMMAALLLGHFGVMADTVQPITAQKLIGAALLMLGVILITRP